MRDTVKIEIIDIGAAVGRTPEPEFEYLVTATIQVVVAARNGVEAAIIVQDELKALIESSEFANDPLNGSIINGIQPLPTVVG